MSCIVFQYLIFKLDLPSGGFSFMNNKSAVLIAKRNLEFSRMRDSGKESSPLDRIKLK